MSDPYAGRSHESPMVPQIMRAIDRLVQSEDDTGCDGGLTVVNKEPVEELRKLHDQWLAWRPAQALLERLRRQAQSTHGDTSDGPTHD